MQAHVKTGRMIAIAPALLVLPLLLALAACSGSSSGSDGGSSSGGTKTNVLAETATGEPALEDAFSGEFVLQSEFRGAGECLDANYLDPNTDHGGAYMTTCDKSDDQVWHITAYQPELYQVWNDHDGDRVCLDSNVADSPVHDGSAFAEPCRAIASQLWSFSEVGDRVRLHSEIGQQSACLESNEPGSEVHNGGTFMDACQDVTGQLWSMVELA